MRTPIALGRRSELLYEQSHKYRLHQDTLRWTLLGGYAAFFAATTGLLATEQMSKRPELTIALSAILVVIGTAYFAVLAVENWYYNVFAMYVRDCDQRLSSGSELQTMEEFSESSAEEIPTFHLSFWFAELIVVAGNTVFLFVLTSTLFHNPIYESRLSYPAIFLSYWIPYVLICHVLLQYSHRGTLQHVLKRLQDLYTPKDRPHREA